MDEELLSKKRAKYYTKSGREIEFYGIYKNKKYDNLFVKLLDHGWEKETCAPGMQNIYNHDENPSAGQCTITSMLAQDYFGGTLRQMHIGAGTHTFNEINGQFLDLTSDQFTSQGVKLDYNKNEIVDRESLNAKPNVFARYQKLKQNVEK